ncbi:MAG: hypothetical protein UR60_C0022G0014 [Candidatus Moranbacteria bacterium GW2011_GWF2_34_56]|nr:MAG: hypothetical protein UR51_C0018G0014 [Candidatus Moranbacteria bacterium GW2011_GWF1_34_10]KKP64384.1 MAG: hypothetical protein UR60_C0022G0014 [Candidatus Moranbacteria bacterium GW2011_GWF2_34_56]HBI16975.1 four helix bundle protein [Candidatus Moranbacteria bacterium]
MSKNKIQSFEDLIVWQEGHKLIISVYKITNNFPQSEVYGLTNQIRRSAVSVTSNIAEGFGRKGYKEKLQFYYLSLGSISELRNQILIARDIGYLSKEDFDMILGQINSTHKLLNLFISKTKTFLTS